MNRQIEQYKDRYIKEVCEFIRIPSRSTPEGGEEAALQAVVAARMRKLGARVRTFDPGDVPGFFEHPLCCKPHRQYANRPTVLGEIGPEDAPALLVLAHSDTVPINTLGEWSFDPFSGRVRDGEILGLGASDDKWGTAALITLLRALGDSGKELKKKLILASTVDEENGVGNGLLLLTLAGIKAEGAIYLDGYQMDVHIGNLGGTFLLLRPKDKSQRDLNPRHKELLKEGSHSLSLKRAPLFDSPFYKDNVKRESSITLLDWKDEKGICFNLNFYNLPGEEKKGVCSELEAMVREVLKEDVHLYEMEYLHPWFEPATVSPDAPHCRCLAASVAEVLKKKAVITTISKQDAFILTNHAKIPTVAFGPTSKVSGKGAFHQVDESLSVDEAWTACQIVYKTALKWLEV